MNPSAFFLILIALLAGCRSTDEFATTEEAICGQPGCEDRCVTICTPFTPCGWPCLRSNGTETTCGQAPAPCGEHTDSDGDGRVNFMEQCCFQGEASIPSHLCPSVNVNHCHF